jgi:hypothetical protein
LGRVAVPTYTWVKSDVSISGSLAHSLVTPITLAIPAGGVVKRFQLRSNLVSAELTGIGYNSVGPGGLLQAVEFVDEHFVSRTIFSSARAIPSWGTALYDPATLQRVYSQYFSAGDNELEINQGCSYGKASDSFAKSITYSPGLFWGVSGVLGPPDGVFQYEFAALYLTLP